MRLRPLATLFVAATLLTSTARADNPVGPGGGKGYDLQLFRPAVDSKGYITVNASQVLGLWDFSVGLVGTLAADPLHLKGANGTSFEYDYLLTPSLQAALGFRYAELAVTVPLQIGFGHAGPNYSFADPSTQQSFKFSGQGVGDVGIHLKGRILNSSKYPVGLGVLVSGYVPSGNQKAFLGDGSFGIAPALILDAELGRERRFRLAFNAGAHLRVGGTHTFTDKGQEFNNPDTMTTMCGPVGSDGSCATGLARSVGNQVNYGLGASYAIVRERFDLLAEVYGAAAIDGSARAFPMEGLLGGKLYLAKSSFMSFGAGGSLIPDQTAGAVWRVFLGFVFEPRIGDKDGDGIKDDIDKCPSEPEDKDGFQDEDGCPDPDNDQDGIQDDIDKCPDQPETRNGFEDEDGCPDKANDDRDGDGIADSVDQCPSEPEDPDHFQDEDGCPDPDNDEDGIVDDDDLCPNDAEDKDGFEDDDGCPDLDNDKDRIPDSRDRCPNQPETYNGLEDEDGCPDKGRVVVTKNKLEILDKVYFETGKATIRPISFPLLDAVAATMKGNPQIQVVEVQGHADERGDDEANLELTDARARAVRDYLIDHGVEASRLLSRGYGETQPVCRQSSESCWAKNRRVEFVIRKRGDDSL